jgi:ApbE superfamily uncharacterized protein (UPF0280 family)
MGLSIKAFDQKGPRTDVARRAALQGVDYLERIARLRTDLCRPVLKVEWSGTDDLVQAMIAAAQAVGDADLTPMAAVAGTLADGVADWLVERGMTRVIVDNGGDLAIRLAPGETVSVGVRTDIHRPEVTHILELDDRSSSWGVTTSGLGGRSFTRGIASAVTAVAHRANYADAAATAIANACWVPDPAIRQVPARLLDPDSDIPQLPVTVGVGALSPGAFARAVARAVDKSDALTHCGVVLGSLVAAGGLVTITEGLEDMLAVHEMRPD